MGKRKRLEWDVTADGCWEVTSHMTNDGGYPTKNYYGRPRRIHRMVYELFWGNVPDGIMVCHTCDNRRCINPDHLYLGTAKDNHDDALDRNRIKQSHVPKKLSSRDVAEIRGSEKSALILSREFGVSRQMIYDIRKGKYWKIAPGKTSEGPGQGWRGDSEAHRKSAMARWRRN